MEPTPSDAPKRDTGNDIGLKTETWHGEQYSVVEEGAARILYPAGHQVFYNPVQEYNRDMSVMMLRLFAEDWQAKGK